MAKIKFITDSASDIPPQLAEQYDITVLPLGIVMDEVVYYERETLQSKEYLQSLKQRQEIPTTTMVPIARMEQEFRRNLDAYDHQIMVTISSKASGTYSAAHMVRQQLEEEQGKTNITVMDSMSFSMVYGKAVLGAAQKAQQGASYEEIISFLERQKDTGNAYFMVDDLQHLQKGGRIKPGIAMVGGLLGIKPILTIKDGLVDAADKARGTTKALERLTDLMLDELKNPQDATIWVANCCADQTTQQLLSHIKQRAAFRQILQYDVGAGVGTHAGTGLVGLVFDRQG